MNYIENTYICLAAPLILAILCLREHGRRPLAFVLSGMTSCLLSAYVNSYIAGVMATDLTSASYEIAPAVEEIMKAMPLLFYLLVFDPDKRLAMNSALMLSVGFATFENVCFLTSYGTSELLQLLIRGFGTGAMHVVCGMIMAVGLFYLWDRAWLRIVGSFALICFAITFHAIFNIFVNQTGIIVKIGSMIPLTVILLYLVVFRKRLNLP